MNRTIDFEYTYSTYLWYDRQVVEEFEKNKLTK